MNVPIASALRMAVVLVLSAAFAAGCALAVTRLAVRTRFFSTQERVPDTWHGRPLHQADREVSDGIDPAPLAFVTFWVSFALAMSALDPLLVG
ncbi:hypothetical protein [Halosimplex amylolyticum]|uniref:hypothetical protein n=1 Tax=Halosimplex amylolyticum TaxID=3396616 RepID=UPI003F574106